MQDKIFEKLKAVGKESIGNENRNGTDGYYVGEHSRK